MRKILPSICVCLSAICFAKAQEVTLDTADSLYNRQKYFEASVWYERELFENSNPANNMWAVKGKINCLKADNRVNEILDFINRSRQLDIPDSFRISLSYEEMLALYLTGSFSGVIENASSIDSSQFSVYELKMAKLIKILSLNELGRWEEADSIYKLYLNEYMNGNATSEQKHQYDNKPALKSERKAKQLSNLLPGAGQIYTGKTWEGIANMLLQLGSLVFVTRAWRQGYYLTSLLIGGSSLEAFRSGGKRRAVNLVHNYNTKLKNAYNDKLRNEVLK